MINFSITKQIENELEEFYNTHVQLARFRSDKDLRYLAPGGQDDGYSFNQAETITLIDLFQNDKFEHSVRDSLGQRKVFMNVVKFRSQVASKQIDIDTKDFRFLPDDYSDPWVSFFLQKDFGEWAKESYFGELVNQCVDAFPKYGTIVLKQVGKNVEFMPLQLLRNEQTAKSLKEAKWVIEEHPDMSMWELEAQPNWNTDGLDMRMDQTIDVYERYGYVPLSWLKAQNDQEILDGDEKRYVNAMVIAACHLKKKGKDKDEHVLYAAELQGKKRPYLEAHWDKQQGRWLGLGVTEDLFENQRAKNIIVNLMRRSLAWAAKRAFQSSNTDMSGKSLVSDFEDGEIVEVGINGEISRIDLAGQSQGEFQQFLNEFENNSNQKAFTFEVSTGESMPTGTPFKLGVLLSNAVNSYFGLKKEKLGLFLKRVMNEFMIPQFIKDMSNEERVVNMFSDEPGFEALKKGAMDWVSSEVVRVSLLSGQAVDTSSIMNALTPFDAVKSLFFKMPANYYQTAKYKFDFTITGEEVDVNTKIASLTALYQMLVQQGDMERANKVMDRVAALGGVNMATFGTTTPKMPMPTAPQAQPQPQPQVVQPTPTANVAA